MYLRIMNPGTCDYRSFIMLGVSSSRDDGNAIGKFGSGIKMMTGLLLRHGIKPFVCIGNLRVEFDYKPTIIDKKEYRQIYINLSGKLDGNPVRRSEDLSTTLEHGIYDWDEIRMGLREAVSNALDACVKNGLSPDNVTIDLVENPRAKKDHTQVFIPYTEEVAKFVRDIDKWFLHFREGYDESAEVLLKDSPGPTLIYHKGVFIRELHQQSIYDYNCNELELDESRNSDVWSCHKGMAQALANNQWALQNVLRKCDLDASYAESAISQYIWSRYKDAFEKAYFAEFGENAILCSRTTQEHVQAKGYSTVCLSNELAEVLKTVARLKKDRDILNGIEMDGFQAVDPTEEMLKNAQEVWNFFEYLNMTYGKEKPSIKGMKKKMEGNVTTRGQYDPSNKVVYINDELSGLTQKITMVHEIAHHISGATDLSHEFANLGFTAIAHVLS